MTRSSTAITCGDVSARTCSGDIVTRQQWCAGGDGTGGDVLGQLDPGPQARRRDRSAAIHCSTWPRMSAAFHADRFAPSRDSTNSTAASRSSEPTLGEVNAACRTGSTVAESPEFVVPRSDHRRAVLRNDLVRTRLRPCSPVPCLPQLRAGLLARMGGPPLGLEPVDVPADLRSPGAEPSGKRREFDKLAGCRVEREPVLGQCRSEAGVGGHGRVPDAVDRLQVVPCADRVQATPLALSEHARVDLQMEMPVRVTRPSTCNAGSLLPRSAPPAPAPDDLAARPASSRAPATQPMICSAARPCAASRAADTSGYRAAASDHVFGPFTDTSTNRSAFASSRRRPLAAPVSTSYPATHRS